MRTSEAKTIRTLLGSFSGRAKHAGSLCKMLRAKRKTLIQTAIEGNIVPQRSKSSSDLLLRLGNNKHAKLQQRGKTTPAGRFYFAQTQTTPETYDIQGTVVQRGSTEFLVTNGKARVLRRLVGNEYTYTRLGRQFFNAKKRHTWCTYRQSSKSRSQTRVAENSWCRTMRSCTSNSSSVQI